MKRQNALKKSRMNPSYCSFSVRENLLCRELAELPLRTLRHGRCLTEQILSVAKVQDTHNAVLRLRCLTICVPMVLDLNRGASEGLCQPPDIFPEGLRRHARAEPQPERAVIQTGNERVVVTTPERHVVFDPFHGNLLFSVFFIYTV